MGKEEIVLGDREAEFEEGDEAEEWDVEARQRVRGEIDGSRGWVGMVEALLLLIVAAGLAGRRLVSDRCCCRHGVMRGVRDEVIDKAELVSLVHAQSVLM